MIVKEPALAFKEGTNSHDTSWAAVPNSVGFGLA
jgi:hypothetical protein